MPYLCNRSTDFDEIWYNDAHWALTADLLLKFRIFENPRWRRLPSWKITKIVMSPQRFGRSLWNLVCWCKMSLLTSPTVKKFEFHESKMADGRHFKNRLIAICLQPFARFWRNLERWRVLALYSGKTVKISNFWKFKMAAAAMLKITKIAIYPQRSLRNLVSWCKIGLLTALTVKKIEFHKSKMADGRLFDNR